jgi:acetyl-CoA carboxylase biotin carboxyl carrier protein
VTADPRSPAPRPADDSTPPAGSPIAADRSEADRLADHAAIDRLADDLVPALIAKLSATGLGEIEVGEGAWTIRVRRPADGAPGSQTRRSSDRSSRAQPGHAGHGHPAGGFEGHRSARETRPVSGAQLVSSNGSGPAPGGATAGSAGRGSGDGSDAHRSIATSPAVGIFQPRPEARAGTRVRSGDRLGAVDMLGVPQEVVAPADGIVGASLVEPGEAVEYGQELIVIEHAARGEAARTPERSEA